jgi:hypothetical protein
MLTVSLCTSVFGVGGEQVWWWLSGTISRQVNLTVESPIDYLVS